MLEDFLNDLGAFLVKVVREQITTPEDRFSKSPRMMKRNSPYNFYASGRGWRSVEYEVLDDEVYVLMEDYMVNYVFGDGSWPGGGKWGGRDTRPPEAKGSKSKLLDALEKWIKDKGITPRDKRGRFMSRRSMAFAIRKNLFKAGYAGYNYQTPDYFTNLTDYIEFLLETPQYQDLALDKTIQDYIDRINTLGTQSFNISLGR